MVFTPSKSCFELSNQASTLFKSGVESGCMACEISALIGSGFGLSGVSSGSFGRLAQAQSVLRSKSGRSFFIVDLGLTELASDPVGLLPVTELLLLDLAFKLRDGPAVRELLRLPADIDIVLALARPDEKGRTRSKDEHRKT